MLVPVEYRERRLDASDGYENTAPSPLDDPYIMDLASDHRKAALAILEAILAMATDEMETSQEPFTTTGPPLRSYHSARNDGPDIVMMLISGFVLIGLIFVVGIFISLLR